MIEFIKHYSSSRGNLYTLKLGPNKLLLECGVPMSKIRESTCFDLHNYIGCLISHAHGDHAKSCHDIILSGVRLYCSSGTASSLRIKFGYHTIKHGKQFKINDVTILPFTVEHDCAEPLGFIIQWKNYKILFATDTYFIRYKFKGLTHIFIECNWSEETAQLELDDIRMKRVIRSHMSLARLKELLLANDLANVKEIQLLHVSRDNGDVEYFKDEIRKLTGVITN